MISDYTTAGVSSVIVGGVVGGVVILLVVVLLCGFGAGVIAVYILRQRKRNEQSNKYKYIAVSLIAFLLIPSQQKK